MLVSRLAHEQYTAIAENRTTHVNLRRGIAGLLGEHHLDVLHIHAGVVSPRPSAVAKCTDFVNAALEFAGAKPGDLSDGKKLHMGLPSVPSLSANTSANFQPANCRSRHTLDRSTRARSNPSCSNSLPPGVCSRMRNECRVWGLCGYVGVFHPISPFGVLNSENCVGAPLIPLQTPTPAALPERQKVPIHSCLHNLK